MVNLRSIKEFLEETPDGKPNSKQQNMAQCGFNLEMAFIEEEN